MTTTAWAAKSPDGEIDSRTLHFLGTTSVILLARKHRKYSCEPDRVVIPRLLSAGWRIVKVKIEETE